MEETQKSLQQKDEEKNALIAQYEAKIKTYEAELEKVSASSKDSESLIQNELEHAKHSLESRNTIISEMSHKYDVDTSNLRKELEQALLNIENITKQNAAAQEGLVSKYEKTLAEKDNVIKQKTEELDAEVKRNLEIQKANLEQVKGDNTKHIEELSNMFKNQLNEKESNIETITAQIREKNAEIEKLKTDVKSFDLSKDDQLQKAYAEVEGNEISILQHCL